MIFLIYDTAKGESVSTFEIKHTNKRFKSEDEAESWWETMTQKKKEDLQQLQASQTENEEIERKIQENKQLEKFLMDANPAKFPWEIQEQRWKYLEMKGGGRKLLDDFADSLIFVNKLYSAAFGPSTRKVPAHMPRILLVWKCIRLVLL